MWWIMSLHVAVILADIKNISALIEKSLTNTVILPQFL